MDNIYLHKRLHSCNDSSVIYFLESFTYLLSVTLYLSFLFTDGRIDGFFTFNFVLVFGEIRTILQNFSYFKV